MHPKRNFRCIVLLVQSEYLEVSKSLEMEELPQNDYIIRVMKSGNNNLPYFEQKKAFEKA